MGYIGKTPGSYWIWRPAAASVGDVWLTLVSEFEGGPEQRRNKWSRPKAQVRFAFDRNTLNHNDLADIWRFYKTQQGMFRTFEVPTFGRLATVASVYGGTGTALGVSDNQDLTTSATSRWHRLWAENAAGGYEVFSVNSVVAANHVEVSAAASATVLAVGDAIYPVLKVRFSQPIQSFDYLPILLGTIGVGFTEVTS